MEKKPNITNIQDKINKQLVKCMHEILKLKKLEYELKYELKDLSKKQIDKVHRMNIKNIRFIYNSLTTEKLHDIANATKVIGDTSFGVLREKMIIKKEQEDAKKKN